MVSTHVGASRSRLSGQEAAMVQRAISVAGSRERQQQRETLPGRTSSAWHASSVTSPRRFGAAPAKRRTTPSLKRSPPAALPSCTIPRLQQPAKQQPFKQGRSAMAVLIALTAFVLFAAGVVAGIIGVVCVAIRRDETNLTLTSQATDHVTRAGRWLNGVGVRAPHRSAAPRHDQYADVIESLYAAAAKSAQPDRLACSKSGDWGCTDPATPPAADRNR